MSAPDDIYAKFLSLDVVILIDKDLKSLEGVQDKMLEIDYIPLQTVVFENSIGDGATIFIMSLSW